jgi:hypothetical protein
MNKKYIDAVKDYAIKHYVEDGWDYIVECYTDNEIWQLIQEADSTEHAIQLAHYIAKIKDEYRKEIQATGDW